MKTHKFNARYRQSVNAVLTEMGLKLSSTRQQIENGTLVYSDPQTDCLYALYESGYIRRFIPNPVGWGTSYNRDNTNYKMYQLNPTRIGTVEHEYNGRIYKNTQKIRILLNPMEQLGQIVIAIQNYRNR